MGARRTTKAMGVKCRYWLFFVIEVDGLAYTQGNKDGRNTLFCVNSQTGELVWKHSYPCAKGSKLFDGGSRVTPAISDGVLYLCSHEGDFMLWMLKVVRFCGRKI